MIVKRQILGKTAIPIAVTALSALLTGCANQPRQSVLTPDQWKNCADEQLVITFTMSQSGSAVFESLGKVAGQLIASECGTGGLTAPDRAAHVLKTIEAMDRDFAKFVRELEARSGHASGD